MNPRWRNILFFVFIPALLGMAAVWLVIPKTGTNEQLAVWDAVISVSLFVLEALILNNILRFYRPSDGKEWNAAAWIILLCAGWFFASISIINFLAAGSPAYLNLVSSTWYLRFFIALLVLTCLALVTWVRRQSESEVKAEKRLSEMRQLSKETELNALRQQLQPHFLFNSLNSIQALTSSNPTKAKSMVIHLSDFLRGTMRKDNDSKHTIADEIAHTKLYLEIEKVRFGDRLKVEWKESFECHERHIPSMVLQPLLENAIKYGVYQTTGPVIISISIVCNKEAVRFQVRNPFDPQLTNTTKGTGFGISSLNRRLFLLFGIQDLITTTMDSNQFTATLRIPAI